MSIANKLSYLNQTKKLIRESINNIGGNLTLSNTFRSYAAELQNIYNRLPKVTNEGTNFVLSPTLGNDKLNILGKGNTTQQTYEGYNLLDLLDGTYTRNGIDITVSNGQITLNGTCTQDFIIRLTNDNNCIISNNKNYCLDLKKEGTLTGRPIYINLYNATLAERLISNRNLSNTEYVSFSSSNNYDNVVFEIYAISGAVVNMTLKPMIYSGEYQSSKYYEPYVGGQASPNPSYPQSVKVVTGDNKVIVHNKNLFNYLNCLPINNNNVNIITENNILQITAISGGTYRYSYIEIDNLTVGDDYTLSFETYTDTSNNLGQFGVVNSNGNYYNKAFNLNERNTFTFTPTETSVTVRIGYFGKTCATGDIITVSNIQLEKGTTATEYVPYKRQEFPLNLGSMELCKIEDYQAGFVPENNKWYIDKKIGKYVADGTENWTTQQQTGFKRYGLSLSSMINDSSLASQTIIKSSHFRGISFNNRATDYDETIYTVCNNSYGEFFINTTQFETVTDFKTWLSSNNITVYYVLATPVREEITNTTLISQLNAIYNAISYSDKTYIETESDEENAQLIVSSKALMGSN